MRHFAITLLLLTISYTLFSQEFEVPKDYKLDKAEDYAAYENDVINGVSWLLETPVSEQAAKRKEVNGFLLAWISGCPNITIEIKQEIVTFLGGEPELLMIFMGGWVKYALQTKDYDNKVEGSSAGIDAVIEFYTKNKPPLKKDKNVEKYIRMKEKGTLKEYIEANA